MHRAKSFLLSSSAAAVYKKNHKEKMSNVFGTAITNGDRTERAIEALEKQYDGRDKEAKAYVDRQKESYGNGISILALIYNATGETITFANSRDWSGRIFDSYPTVIRNGQWGAFLHTKAPTTATGSEAAIVYRVRNDSDNYSELLVAWNNPWSGANSVYSEINDINTTYDWNAIQKKLEGSSLATSAIGSGLLSVVNTTQYTSPYLNVQFLTLELRTNGEENYQGKSWKPLQLL